MISENGNYIKNKTKKFISENEEKLIEAREFVKEQKQRTSILWEESKKSMSI